MASFSLCNSTANLHKNLQQSLASVTFTTSNNQTSTSISCQLSPHKPLSAKFPNLRIHSGGVRRKNSQIFNQYVHKSKELAVSSQESPLKIGIIGFGNFGQFISKAFLSQGHIVLATSRSDYSEYCQENGIEFFQNVDSLCEEQPDVVLVCSSILSTESVIRGIPMHKLKKDTIFADVLSVKQYPKNLFIEALPQEFGIVCTHPMFGPESGKNGWDGLPFVFDKVRVAENSEQEEKCRNFLNVFEHEGCRMVEMSCEEHDRHAAGSQFVTHTIGRVLSELELESTPINTKGYESLLQLTKNTVNDSFDLYYGLFMYNVNATEQIENLDRAFETVKQKLFGRLHDILRKQIVERVPVVDGLPQAATAKNNASRNPFFLPNTQAMKQLSSFAVPPPPPENTTATNVEPHFSPSLH